MGVKLEIKNLVRPGLKIDHVIVPAGEALAVMGPSGAGKSLFLRAVADLDQNDASIALNGTPRDDFAAPDWRRKVGYLPAEPAWWSDVVSDHFKDRGEAERLAARLGIEAPLFDKTVARTSTGERQRLGLVRALLVEPEVLLLDEPTSALDEVARDQVEEVTRDFLRQDNALILVTHDEGQARRMADGIMRLDKGKQTGPIETIENQSSGHPKSLEERR